MCIHVVSSPILFILRQLLLLASLKALTRTPLSMAELRFIRHQSIDKRETACTVAAAAVGGAGWDVVGSDVGKYRASSSARRSCKEGAVCICQGVPQISQVEIGITPSTDRDWDSNYGL